MGQANPFFERAGFARVGVIRKAGGGRAPARGLRRPGDAADRRDAPQGPAREPVYYVFDNRTRDADGGAVS